MATTEKAKQSEPTKQIFVALTNAHSWGKGKTLVEALNNAHAKFKDKIAVSVYYNKDGSDITQDDYEKVSVDAIGSTWSPANIAHQNLTVFSLTELSCCNVAGIATELLRLIDKKPEINYNDIDRFEKMLEKIDVII